MANKFLSGLFGRKDAGEPEVPSDAPAPSDGTETNPGDKASTQQTDENGAAATTPDADIPPSPEEGGDNALEADKKSWLSRFRNKETSADDSPPELVAHEQPIEPEELAKNDAVAAKTNEEPAPPSKRNWFSRLTDGLSKSSSKLSDGVASIFTKKKLDDEALEELEDLLITADLGVAAAGRVSAALAKEKFDKEVTDNEVRTALAQEVAATLTPLERTLAANRTAKPHVILMIGVNGAGKTTTIGKLARKYKDDGLSVMLAAGDTFRAAAIEQLSAWGDRVDAPVISRDVGADAAGLAFDAVKEAQAQNTDVLLIDTAGRLQNKAALMDELAKIVRVLKKLDPDAPHDVVLVLDATVGQNAVSQAQHFSDVAGVTGLIMTKLDGTARGGVLVALADNFKLPIHFVGVGESVDDLQPFRADAFARALAGVDA